MPSFSNHEKYAAPTSTLTHTCMPTHWIFPGIAKSKPKVYVKPSSGQCSGLKDQGRHFHFRYANNPICGLNSSFIFCTKLLVDIIQMCSLLSLQNYGSQ